MKKLTITSILVSIIFIFGSHAKAADVIAYLGGWSFHTSDLYDYNQDHEATILEVNRFVFGRFKNSFHQESYVAGYNFSVTRGAFDFGVMPSIVSGYKDWMVMGGGMEWNHFGDQYRVAPILYAKVSSVRVQPTMMFIGDGLVLMAAFRF